MRNLLILIGPPLSRKSSWIKENNLEDFTLSYDTLRLMYKQPTCTPTGKVSVNEIANNEVISTFNEMLRYRMSEGAFTVVDNMHIKNRDFKTYLNYAKKYGYRLWVRDFRGGAQVEDAIVANKWRGTKHIPEVALRDLYEKMNDLKLNSKYTPIDELSEIKNSKKIDFKKVDHMYESIYFIGDIHGCIDELNIFLKNHYNPNSLYVFTGDYIDRGPSSSSVVKTLNELYEKGNVVLIEGNHEKWLRYWSEDFLADIRSKEFLNSTLVDFTSKSDPDSDKNNLTKSQARSFLNKLQVYSALEFKGKKLFACHGGIPRVDGCHKSYSQFAASNYISGAGSYSSLMDMYATEPMGCDLVIHGHRNKGKKTIQGNYINLEGSVENGGELRCFRITDNEEFHVITVKSHINYMNKAETIMEEFRNSTLVKETVLEPTLSAFNFSKEAFYGKLWSNLTVKARGLFVNTDDDTVAARSYNKFFNTNERSETEWESLKELDFPVTSVEKGNGYLGITSYDKRTGNLLVASKSTTKGIFKEKFEELLHETLDTEQLNEICRTENVSFVFEVIIPEWDPHIIRYDKSELILLNVIENSFVYRSWSREKVEEILKTLTHDPKKLRLPAIYGKYENYKDMINHLKEVRNHYIEGLVLEDSSGFMFKYKTPYYGMVKQLRGYLELCKKTEGDAPMSRYLAAMDNYNYLFESPLGSEWGIISKRDALTALKFVKEHYSEYTNIIDLYDNVEF